MPWMKQAGTFAAGLGVTRTADVAVALCGTMYGGRGELPGGGCRRVAHTTMGELQGGVGTDGEECGVAARRIRRGVRNEGGGELWGRVRNDGSGARRDRNGRERARRGGSLNQARWCAAGKCTGRTEECAVRPRA